VPPLGIAVDPPLGVSVEPPLGVAVDPPLGVDVVPPLAVAPPLLAVLLLEELDPPFELLSVYVPQATARAASDTAATDTGTSRKSSFKKRFVVIWKSP
jgi:hypothetical protein